MAHGSSQTLSAADYLRAFYELPLGLTSFALFNLLHKVVRRIGCSAYRKKPALFSRWNILCGEVLDQPHQLSRYIVIAPRWNPHAAVASAGPFPVTKEITLEISDAISGVGYWFFGAYPFPKFGSANYVSSLTKADSNGRISLQLEKGDYYLACRYYGLPEQVRYPAIWVDGKEIIPTTQASNNMNDFYPTLPQRGKPLYRAAHYHAYVMLKYSGLFSAAFVKKHLLPVGNEDTVYLYGTVKKGAVLCIRFPQTVLNDHHIYCTCYNTASLPVFISNVETPEFLSDPLICNSMYLIRVMRRKSNSDAEVLEKISVTTTYPINPEVVGAEQH